MKTSERVSFVYVECAEGVSCLIRSLIGFLVVLLCPLATQGGHQKGKKIVYKSELMTENKKRLVLCF